MKNNSAKTNPLLLIFISLTILSFSFGFWKLRDNIYSPFSRSKMVATTLSPEEQLKILTQDTDQDGLPDIQETSIGTSIYLPDTDSDGFFDKEESETGSNPLDPASTSQNKIASKEPVILEQLVGATMTEKEEKIEGGFSLSEIREKLVSQGGLSQEIVDKVDDETLLKLYNETKAELGGGLEKFSTGSFDFSKLSNQLFASDIDKTFFQSLTGSQIRQLLIEVGVDKKLLEAIDDEILKILFLQALESK